MSTNRNEGYNQSVLLLGTRDVALPDQRSGHSGLRIASDGNIYTTTSVAGAEKLVGPPTAEGGTGGTAIQQEKTIRVDKGAAAPYNDIQTALEAHVDDEVDILVVEMWNFGVQQEYLNGFTFSPTTIKELKIVSKRLSTLGFVGANIFNCDLHLTADNMGAGFEYSQQYRRHNYVFNESSVATVNGDLLIDSCNMSGNLGSGKGADPQMIVNGTNKNLIIRNVTSFQDWGGGAFSVVHFKYTGSNGAVVVQGSFLERFKIWLDNFVEFRISNSVVDHLRAAAPKTLAYRHITQLSIIDIQNNGLDANVTLPANDYTLVYQGTSIPAIV